MAQSGTTYLLAGRSILIDHVLDLLVQHKLFDTLSSHVLGNKARLVARACLRPMLGGWVVPLGRGTVVECEFLVVGRILPTVCQ
jgi:hypothetical protein